MKIIQNIYFQFGLKSIVTLLFVYFIGLTIRLGWNPSIYILILICFICSAWYKKHRWQKTTLQLFNQFTTIAGKPEKVITERMIKKLNPYHSLTATCHMPGANITLIIHQKRWLISNQIILNFLLETDVENHWKELKNDITDFASQHDWLDNNRKIFCEKDKTLHACTLSVPLPNSPTPVNIEKVTYFLLMLIRKHQINSIDQYVYFRETLNDNHYYIHHRNCSIIASIILNKTEEYLAFDIDEIPDNINLSNLSSNEDFKDVRLITQNEFDKMIQEYR